jgi:hypothetical protein
MRSAVGIPVVHGREDVNSQFMNRIDFVFEIEDISMIAVVL